MPDEHVQPRTLQDLARDPNVDLHFRVPEGMHKLLKVRAAIEGHTMANYVRLLIRRDLLQAGLLRPQ